ncbi:MAG: hypothetical protein QF441_03535 [Bacteriovoracaceae bacterium]|nr:hypothetical protein [Bacteriovoracaceae bacterium]
MKNFISELADEFSSQTHGSSDFWKDHYFIRGEKDDVFLPLSFLQKKDPKIKDTAYLQANGYVISSLTYLDLRSFDKWYKKMFNRKLTLKEKKAIDIIHFPDSKKIFEAVEIVDQVYQILKDHKVLVNGKNLPVQLGEWYAKLILGLHQKKSSSQRGFDFYTHDNKKIEVKIHWQDTTSPKGVKLKKSLVEMSDYTVVMYVAKNFMLRDILLLDSDFVIRKFAGKGHTIFLKDSDIHTYFFSKSNKHYDKIVNKTALMQFSSPSLALKIDEKINTNG